MNAIARLHTNAPAQPGSSERGVLSMSKGEWAVLNGHTTDEPLLRFPLGAPERLLMPLLRRALRMNEDVRAANIDAVVLAHGDLHPWLSAQLLLALGDGETWSLYFKKCIEGRVDVVTHFGVGSFWAQHITMLPEAQRRAIAQAAAGEYHRAKSSADGHGSDKREFDYATHAALRGGEAIMDRLKRGEAPWVAYDVLLQRQHVWMAAPKQRRGGYDAQLVQAALLGLQTGMRELGVAKMVVGGSLTRGLADLRTSDVDFIVDDPRGAALAKPLTRFMQAELVAAGFHTGLHADHFPGPLATPKARSYPDDLASSNPVLFGLSPDTVEMWIYPTKPWMRGKSPESVLVAPHRVVC